jgi:23S rRNA (adenine2503-C2)-methyltransferase
MNDSTANVPIRLKNLPLEGLRSAIIELGEPAFRAQQVIKWVYQKRVGSFAEMTTLSKPLREKLNASCTVEKMPLRRMLVSQQNDAVKFVFGLIESSQSVECVLLYDGKRRTACLSSQLGCGLGCVFCATGTLGFIRNLTQEEIIGQLIGINDYLAQHDDKPVTNVVFMGMGEALSNFDRVRSALDIIMHEETFNIGGRRITISTAGVIPSIERLMREDLNVGLAISLNAVNDRERSELMPINRSYPIASLVNIAKQYFAKTGRRVTFEYVLIAGKTDTPAAAARLQELLGGFPCKINLIPINPYGASDLVKPSERQLLWFADELHRRGLSATVRKSRGQDIRGACGQLVAGGNETDSTGSSG